jgi:chromosome segregation ATPase
MEDAETRCALEGCDNPLPPPAIDERGRRKGGRPSSYCCKAHADAASRARRAGQLAAITDPLVELKRATELFVPAVAPLLDALSEMRGRLETAESAALAQVQQADVQAAEARAEAEEAHRRAEQADRARLRTLEQAKDDREARTAAETAARKATEAADRSTREAWVQVAEHERARGAAEAAGAAAAAGRDDLAVELRTARTQLAELLQVRDDLAARLERTREELRTSAADHALALDRLDGTRKTLAAVEASLEHARREAQDARAHLAAQGAELADTRTRIAEEHAARRVAEARLEAVEARAVTAEQGAERLRGELAEAHARLDRMLAAQHEPPSAGAEGTGHDAPTPDA